jgi:hypothetical protein
VSLTLLSGNPVTFRQSLFESYYVARPMTLRAFTFKG